MRKNSGFSLMELMIVIAIIATVTAISSPYLFSYISSSKLDSAVRDLQSTMQYAKLRAVKENANVVITFITTGAGSSGEYTAFVDDGGTIAANANNWIQDPGEAIIRRGTMPNNVDMYSVIFTGDDGLRIMFNGRGLSRSPNGGISAGGAYMRIASQNRFKGVIVNFAGRPRIAINRNDGKGWVDE